MALLLLQIGVLISVNILKASFYVGRSSIETVITTGDNPPRWRPSEVRVIRDTWIREVQQAAECQM